MTEAQTSFTMSTTSTEGKKSTKAVTNINPNAGDGKIYGLARAMNNLTTNTLNDVTRVTKQEIELANFVDTVLTISTDNDDNNAVTISGNTITVDYTKLPQTTDLADCVFINITTTSDTAEMNEDFAVKLTHSSHTGSQVILSITDGVAVLPLYKSDNNNIQEAEITFAQREGSSGKVYSPATVYIKTAQ